MRSRVRTGKCHNFVKEGKRSSQLNTEVSRQRKRTLKPVLAGVILSAAISFMLFLYAPLELYFANKKEFWFDFYRLGSVMLLVFLVMAVAGSFVFFILCLIHERLYQVGLAAGFVVFLAVYIQGNFLIKNLPSLDGTAFDWSQYGGERIKSVIVCLTAMAVVLLLIHFLHMEKFYHVVKIVSSCIVLVLSVTLVSLCIRNDGLEKKRMQVTTHNLYEMSDDQNFIILLLDAVDARNMTELLEQNPEYREMFSDFNYYPNMMGAYSSTQMAIPYIFSGEWFEHEQPFDDYNANVYKTARIFDTLEQSGYKLGMYEAELPAKDESIYRFDNILSKQGQIVSYWEFLKAELKLVGVKYAPFDLKRFCIFDTSYFAALQKAPEGYETYNWLNYAFYPDMLATPITHTDQKIFKFIHVEGAHVPLRYDENVEFIDNATYTDNVKASMTIARTYLERLKEENVYDNSVIIVMADHGYADTVVSNASLERQNPIFFVKGVNEKHELQVSNAPVSFTDLQEAFDRLLTGCSGDAIFDAKEGEQRERRYLYFEWLKEDHIEEYYQTGDAWDLTTLKPTGVVYDQKNSVKEDTSGEASSGAGLSWLYAPLEWIMNWCYALCHNYGLAIILFTLISKLVLLPVSVWVQKNSIKMVELQPDINFLKVKYFGDKDAIAEGQTRLFKQKKYHPLASMIPLVIQILLLMGVIAVIKAGMNDPKVSMDFLGVNLSLVPSENGGWLILSPIVAALSAWLMCVAQNASNVLQSEQSKWNKYGTLLLSVGLSLYLGWFVSVGVALYWVASNLLAIVQLYLLNWAINPKKYVDYERLEASKKELAELGSIGTEKRKRFDDPDAKREREDYKRFFNVVNKHLVFYSESGGFYKYYKGIIEYLLQYTSLTIHYVTSDPKDSIFALSEKEPAIRAYYIGEKRLITLMMKLEADIVVMTMPDLENYHIKRSYVRKDIEYIYIPHGMDSLNLTMRTHSMDHYDTVFCVGKHQKEEIAKTEELYQSPKKNLVEWGYTLLDEMCADYGQLPKEEHDRRHILIAPSWQPDNIVDSCLTEILDALAGKGYYVTVRPHPQHVRHKKEKMESLKQRYAENPDIEIQTDFSSNSTVFEADLMITDWSGIAYEYAYTTKKPVLFINTPMKVMNPEYDRIDTVPLNILLRDEIGCSLNLDQLDRLAETVDTLLGEKDNYAVKIGAFVDEYVYNLGNSARVGARYIIAQLQEKVRQRKTCAGKDAEE